MNHRMVILGIGWYHNKFSHLCVKQEFKKQFYESHHSDFYPLFVHEECETPSSGFMELKNCMKIGNGCLHNHYLFSKCIYLLILLKQYPVDTLDKFSCWITESCPVLYNIQSDDKYENKLKEWGWDAYHLFPGHEY